MTALRADRAQRRAFVVVLDACGAGALPDAEDYGDGGASTLVHLAEQCGGLRLPAMGEMGLGTIVAVEGVPPAEHPVLHGRLHALGPGKDSTAGHWELMGVVMEHPPPTYPSGFPDAVVELIAAISDRRVLCNRPCNGIEAIEQFGAEHLASGALILYTSQDSVLQLAAHVERLGPEELYAVCAEVRRQLPAGHAIGRVIARPFTGAPGAFERTDGRRDFSVAPPARSYLEELRGAGIEVHAVGKVGQLFAGVGVDAEYPGATNAQAIAQTTELMQSLQSGLVFTNLIETDQVFGHRHDAPGFALALERIDRTVARWLGLLGPEDLLILTSDHGCDVTSPRTDHTREHAFLLASFAGHRSRHHDGPMADVGASVLRWLAGRGAPSLPGESFI